MKSVQSVAKVGFLNSLQWLIYLINALFSEAVKKVEPA